MLNIRQEELIKEFIAAIQQRFPEVELIEVTPSPENPNDLWLNVTAPDDEDREIELIEFAAEKGTDILLDYGYHLLVMPEKRTAVIAREETDPQAAPSVT